MNKIIILIINTNKHKRSLNYSDHTSVSSITLHFHKMFFFLIWLVRLPEHQQQHIQSQNRIKRLSACPKYSCWSLNLVTCCRIFDWVFWCWQSPRWRRWNFPSYFFVAVRQLNSKTTCWPCHVCKKKYLVLLNWFFLMLISYS